MPHRGPAFARPATEFAHGPSRRACRCRTRPGETRRGPGDDPRGRDAHQTRRLVRPARAPRVTPHSHSIVPGGLLVTSRTTRLTPGTSLVIRLETRARTA